MTGAIVILLLIAGGFFALIFFAGKIFRSNERNQSGGDGAPIYYAGDGHVHSDSCGHGDAGGGGDGGGGDGGGGGGE